eukprot:TRINITY_DN94214_c0_g1_i1.p1 TRINITY_DN94214_c0_g1~~TRINITY_DN94214_c0_g1_i1.p1  ORF type:complete len:125 (-),score=21.30 TRINITY_DN94214_c0_g1_i1:114-488(-)
MALLFGSDMRYSGPEGTKRSHWEVANHQCRNAANKQGCMQVAQWFLNNGSDYGFCNGQNDVTVGNQGYFDYCKASVAEHFANGADFCQAIANGGADSSSNPTGQTLAGGAADAFFNCNWNQNSL